MISDCFCDEIDYEIYKKQVVTSTKSTVNSVAMYEMWGNVLSTRKNYRLCEFLLKLTSITAGGMQQLHALLVLHFMHVY